MSTTRTIPTRGETFTLPAQCFPFVNAVPLLVNVTYARRSLAPSGKGACLTFSAEEAADHHTTGWYIEYRTIEDGPLLDANTPGLHSTYVADAWI